MGTTLTGTTPQDTYDSLIKVTDNGPLSGTAKFLSDGLGNDSALALSTGNIGIGTTAPSVKLDIVGSIRIDEAGTSTDVLTLRSSFAGVGPAVNVTTSSPLLLMTANTERLRITSAGNVGIGTTAPQQKLQIGGSGGTLAGTAAISFTDNNSGSSRNWVIANGASASGVDQIGVLTISRSNALSGDALAAGTEIARFSANGLSFNGDTAAANALDDYEEGTWTMGVTFGGGSVGVTVDSTTGTYTKIGRQVTVNGLLQLTNKGSSTGTARISGLPFTIANSTGNYGTASLRLTNITFTNQFQGFGVINTTTISLEEVTILGAVTDLTDADFANNSAILISLTYFV